MSDDRSVRGEHYFSESPSRTGRNSTTTLTACGTVLTLRTTAGVFSSAGVDKGTSELLDHLEKHPPITPPDGSVVVDLGCGAGPIALVLAVMYPKCTILAVDVNRAAVALCHSNARDNNLDNVVCRHPDDVAPTERAVIIVSNPPIRIGKAALHELLRTWLGRLDPGGVARLVVGRHLGADSLAEWLEREGHRVNRLASRKGFRLLEVLPNSGEGPQ
jgi:16S rRNA (guanine1207-N2)-methyltransferase